MTRRLVRLYVPGYILFGIELVAASPIRLEAAKLARLSSTQSRSLAMEPSEAAETEEPLLPSDETVQFIFEHIKGAASEQHQVWVSLDSKIVSIFGAGSALVGLAGLTLSKGAPTPSLVIAILVGLSVGAYATAAGAALVHLWPKSARHTSYGATLWPEAWFRDVKAIRHGLIVDMTEATTENRESLSAKAKTVRVAVASVGAETLLIGAAFVLRLLGF